MPRPPLTLLLAALLALSPAIYAQDADKPTLALDAGGHTAIVRKVLFTPDGKELVTVSDDKTIRTWDVASGEPLRVLRPPVGKGPEGMLYAVAFSPDGKTLAVGGYTAKDTTYLINLASGQVERVLTGHTSSIFTLAFSPDGRRIASGSGDKTARVWDAATGECLYTLQGHAHDIYRVAFSPDGRRLATASLDRTARVWATATGDALVTFNGHGREVRCICWNPDGKTLATGCDDYWVRLWGTGGGSGRKFCALGNAITSVRYTADGRALLVTTGTEGAEPGVCSLLDSNSGKELVRFDKHTNTIYDSDLSPDGTLAATTGGNDAETYVWRTASGEVVHRLAGKGKSVWATAWGKDGKSLAWGFTNRNETANAESPLEHTFRTADLVFGPSPDATYCRTRVTRGSVSIVADGRTAAIVRQAGRADVRLNLESAYDQLWCFTLLPSNRAAVGANYGLSLFDTRTGLRLRQFQGHTGPAMAVAPSPEGRFILSASVDQTVRVWHPDRDEPLLSLFVAEDDWVAWTPEGYYACSPGGEKLMGWHVNNGPDKMASFYPAEKFRKTLYRPDVIKRLLDAGSVERALELADEARGTRTEQTKVADVLPPKVTITSPTSGSKLDRSKIVVRATANSVGDHPVTALRLLVDGRPQGQPKRVDQSRIGEVSESWVVQLSPGKHRLQALADSAVSNGTSSEVEVTYSTPVAPEIVLPKLYILAVGVSAYNNEALKLNYAAKDAEAVADAFRTHSKPLFRGIEVRLVTDAKATRGGVFAGVRWLRQQITQNDVGVVFFSGHGDKDAGKLYFLPVDADPADLVGTCVSATEMTDVVAALPGKVLLILDACHSGGADAPKQKGVGSLTDDLVRDLVTDEKGLIVMASSTGREASLENNKLRMGNFTAALTEGLSGKAQKIGGAVYLNHLDSYVTDRVKELTNGRQHPVTAKPTSVRSFPLSRP